MKETGYNADSTQRVIGPDTFDFLYKKDTPKGKKIIYIQFCWNIRLQKDKINRIWLTVGGDRLDHNRNKNTEIIGLYGGFK